MARDSAPIDSPTACDPTRFETRPRLTGILLAIASLLVIISAGCGDGQVPADGSSKRAAPLSYGAQLSLVAFPRHDYPLGTDRGEDYFAGQLVLREGCLRIEVPADDSDDISLSRLVIWPNSFTFAGLSAFQAA